MKEKEMECFLPDKITYWLGFRVFLTVDPNRVLKQGCAIIPSDARKHLCRACMCVCTGSEGGRVDTHHAGDTHHGEQHTRVPSAHPRVIWLQVLFTFLLVIVPKLYTHFYNKNVNLRHSLFPFYLYPNSNSGQ